MRPAARRWIAGWRWSVIAGRRWTQQLCKNGFQAIRPYLVALDRRMQFIARVHHPLEKPTIGIRELVVHVEIAQPAVGEARELRVDPTNLRHHGHVVVTRENAGEDDRRVGRFTSTDVDERAQTARDIRDCGFVAWLRSDVVRSREHDDDLRVHTIELAMFEAPENVLDLVGAPSEVGGVPAEEIRPPVREQLRVVEGAPAAGDRVADEIDIDAPLSG